MKIDMVQPRHNCAPPADVEALGHVYMPTSLLSAGARMLEAGVDVCFHDENIAPYSVAADADKIGINLLGAPYIPEAIKLMDRLDREAGRNLDYILGGQVIAGLEPWQFEKLFGERAVSGNDDFLLQQALGLTQDLFPETRSVSLIPAYELLSDQVMKLYLEQEMGFYLSNGCSFRCNSCAVEDRTRIEERADGSIHVVQTGSEKYRHLDIVREDLTYLVGRAKSLGVETLSLYLSNLDLFQTPAALEKFADIVLGVSEQEQYSIKMRGLSCVTSIVRVARRQPEIITKMKNAGLYAVGFGVDGWGRELWEMIGKKQNTEEDSIEAIRLCSEDFGLTPEVLMVFGYALGDTQDSLNAALNIVQRMASDYGAIPRPHLAKSFIPGNSGWNELSNTKAIRQLIESPALFQALDFTALASPLTHSNGSMRGMANEYFLKMCQIEGNTTKPIVPLEPGMSVEEISQVVEANLRQYDR